MRYRLQFVGMMIAVAGCYLGIEYGNRASALQEGTVLILEPTPEAVGESPSAGELPSPTYPACIVRSKADNEARRMYDCSDDVIPVTFVVDDPCDCTDCLYEVPLCLPSCCVGEPTVCSRAGAFDRGIVEYCWPCGFRAKVVFRHVLGGVVIHYHGCDD